MNGPLDFPPKNKVKTIEDDPKNLVSGITSIESEGDESGGGSGEKPSDPAEQSIEPITMEEVLQVYEKAADKKPVSGKAPKKKSKSTNTNAQRRHGRGRGEPSTDSTEEEVSVPPSFSASTQIRVEQPASEFTGAAFKNFPLEDERVTLRGDMPDSGPKTDSVAEVRARLLNLVRQAGHQSEAAPAPIQVEEQQASPEEIRMQELEVKLREQTKKFYSKENRLFRLGHAELRKTEQAYNKALAELAKSRKSSGELNGLEIVNEVMRKGVEAKREARKKALSIDDRYAFEKALSLIPLGSKWLDTHLGKSNARAARALATAVVVVGGGAALGAFGAASIGALLGYGTFKFARTLTSAVLAGAAVKGSDSWLNRILGRKQESANKELSELTLEGEPDDKAIEEMRIKIEKLLEKADDKTKERKKLIYQGLIAMGVGGSVSGLVTLFDIDFPFGSSPSSDSNVTKPAMPAEEAAQPLRVEVAEPVAPSEPVSAPAEPVSVQQPEEQPAPRAPRSETVRIERPPVESVAPVESRPEPVPEEGSGMTTAELNRASLAEATEAVESLGTQEPDISETEPEPIPEVPKVEESIDTSVERPEPVQDIEIPDAAPEPEAIEQVSRPEELPTPDTEEAVHPDEPALDTLPEEKPIVERPVPQAPSETPVPSTSVPHPEQGGEVTERATEGSEAPGAREMVPFTNIHNLSIDPRVPDVFTNANGTITAYGGTFAERFTAAQDYALEHPGTVVHLEASRLLRGEDGVLRPWITRVFVDPVSLQMNADASPAGPQFIGAPDPQTFTAIAR